MQGTVIDVVATFRSDIGMVVDDKMVAFLSFIDVQTLRNRKSKKRDAVSERSWAEKCRTTTIYLVCNGM